MFLGEEYVSFGLESIFLGGEECFLGVAEYVFKERSMFFGLESIF